MLKLYIGNKNYSSWSMRPWVLLKQAGIPFEEVMVKFDDMADGSPFKAQMRQIAPTVRVPVLVDGDVLVWGGASRLVFHGVRPLGVKSDTRYNITLRRAG